MQGRLAVMGAWPFPCSTGLGEQCRGPTHQPARAPTHKPALAPAEGLADVGEEDDRRHQQVRLRETHDMSGGGVVLESHPEAIRSEGLAARATEENTGEFYLIKLRNLWLQNAGRHQQSARRTRVWYRGRGLGLHSKDTNTQPNVGRGPEQTFLPRRHTAAEPHAERWGASPRLRATQV